MNIMENLAVFRQVDFSAVVLLQELIAMSNYFLACFL